MDGQHKNIMSPTHLSPILLTYLPISGRWRHNSLDVMHNAPNNSKLATLNLAFQNFTQNTTSHNCTRNVLDCDQSNYSSRITYSYTFTLGSNMNWTGWTVSEIWPFKIIQDGWRPWSWIWSNRK